MPRVHLRSLEALRDFGDKLGAARHQLPIDLDQMQKSVWQHVRQARDRVSLLEERLREAELAVEVAEQQKGGTPDYYAVSQAQDALYQAEYHLTRIEDAASNLMSRISQVSERIAGRFEEARSFVAGCHQEALKYRAVAMPNEELPVGTEGRRQVGNTQSGLVQEPRTPVSLCNVKYSQLPPLPRNMEWVKISDIDPLEVPNDMRFEKVPKSQMKQMMETFEGLIVPALQASGTGASGGLNGLRGTAQAGDTSADPAFAYECMLGGYGSSDVVAVEADGREQDKKWSVSSGRHRILAAKELGWTYIPARILGRGR